MEPVEIVEPEVACLDVNSVDPDRTYKDTTITGDTPNEDNDITMAGAGAPEQGTQKAADMNSGDGATGLGDRHEMTDGHRPSPDNAPPGIILDRPPPGRSGLGRTQQERFYHTVPESHSGGTPMKRAVFRKWPRDPNGKPLVASQETGTLSPDGYPWGETLYDFFSVYKQPESATVSFMTGSALLEAASQIGELDVAAPEIEWAKSEGKPRVEAVADMELLVFDREDCIRMQAARQTVGNMDGHDNEVEESKSEKEKDSNDDDDSDISIAPSPTTPATSPFHPSHYPRPWPTVPFKDSKPIHFQERLPMHLFPQKLYVHDPHDSLSAQRIYLSEKSWDSQPDVIHTYELNLTPSVLRDAQETRRKAEELEEFKSRTLIVLRYKRTKEQIENYEPEIEVPLPPHVRRPTRVEESHLYLSPAERLGRGNHSVVYEAEWEVPRDLFVRPKICTQCFKESTEKEIKKLKDTGRWDELMKATIWESEGFTGCQPTEAELDGVSDSPVNLARDGEVVEREVVCVVPPDAAPSQILNLLDEKGIWDMLMKQGTKTTERLDLTANSGEKEESCVAHLRISPPFSYESQKTCTHDKRFAPSPRTTTLGVAAKLSIEYDPHLAREARNYQQFPEHLFHHYNGYTFLPQLYTQAVVPVGAVVPQFYGYYTPESCSSEYYLSPILLLEQCGKPIDVCDLSHEDQAECASLVLRFQSAGWLHESVAERNLLVQVGKPTEFLYKGMATKPETSFRLIDFGRSRRWTTETERQSEEREVLGMFSEWDHIVRWYTVSHTRKDLGQWFVRD